MPFRDSGLLQVLQQHGPNVRGDLVLEQFPISLARLPPDVRAFNPLADVLADRDLVQLDVGANVGGGGKAYAVDG